MLTYGRKKLAVEVAKIVRNTIHSRSRNETFELDIADLKKEDGGSGGGSDCREQFGVGEGGREDAGDGDK